MINKNQELIGILNTINPVSYNGMAADDFMVVFAGVFELHEQLIGSNKTTANKPFPWACIRSVIEGYIAGVGIVELYKSMISSGATWTTVRSFLWNGLKRYAGWWTVGFIIYDIYTNCF